MYILILRFIACLTILLMLSVAGFAQGKSLKGKYQNVEVVKFEIKDGVTFPGKIRLSGTITKFKPGSRATRFEIAFLLFFW